MSDDIENLMPRPRGRPRADEEAANLISDLLENRIGWAARILRRVVRPPTIADTIATLDALGPNDDRRIVADALLSFLVPVNPDVEQWVRWANGGSAPITDWVKHPKVDGPIRGQDKLKSMTRAAKKHTENAEEYRKKALEFTAKAEEAEANAEICTDQGRAFAIVELDIALQESIRRAFSMGAGWTVLKAIATTDDHRAIMERLDQLSGDADFLKAFGAVIQLTVMQWQAVPLHEPLRGLLRKYHGHLGSLPDEVDENAIRVVLERFTTPPHSTSEMSTDAKLEQLRERLGAADSVNYKSHSNLTDDDEKPFVSSFGPPNEYFDDDCESIPI